MSDCVEREAVLETLRKSWLSGTVAHRIIDDIGDKIWLLPAVEPERPTGQMKWKTKNGINYPEGLEEMSFTHELSVEERNNLIEAYTLGYYEGVGERPKGHWVVDERMVFPKCSCCKVQGYNSFDFCPMCGADMREE